MNLWLWLNQFVNLSYFRTYVLELMIHLHTLEELTPLTVQAENVILLEVYIIIVYKPLMAVVGVE